MSALESVEERSVEVCAMTPGPKRNLKHCARIWAVEPPSHPLRAQMGKWKSSWKVFTPIYQLTTLMGASWSCHRSNLKVSLSSLTQPMLFAQVMNPDRTRFLFCQDSAIHQYYTKKNVHIVTITIPQIIVLATSF